MRLQILLAGLAMTSTLISNFASAQELQVPKLDQYILIEPVNVVRGDYKEREEAIKKILIPFADPIEFDTDAKGKKSFDINVHVTQAIAIKAGSVPAALESLRTIDTIEASVLTDVLKKKTSVPAAKILGELNSQTRAIQNLEQKMRLAAEIVTSGKHKDETWAEEANRINAYMQQSIDFQNARNLFQMNLNDLRVRADVEGDYKAEFAIMAVGGSNSLIERFSKNPMVARYTVQKLFSVIDRSIDQQMVLAGERLKLGEGAIAAERANWGDGVKYFQKSDIEELMHYGGDDIKDIAFRSKNDTNINEFFLFGNYASAKEILRMLISVNPEVARFTHQRLIQSIISAEAVSFDLVMKLRAVDNEIKAIASAHSIKDAFKDVSFDEIINKMRAQEARSTVGPKLGNLAYVSMIVEMLSSAASMEFQTNNNVDRNEIAKEALKVLIDLKARVKTEGMVAVIKAQQERMNNNAQSRFAMSGDHTLKALAKNFMADSGFHSYTKANGTERIRAPRPPRTCEAIF